MRWHVLNCERVNVEPYARSHAHPHAHMLVQAGIHVNVRAGRLQVYALRHVQAILNGVLGQPYLTETACLN